MEPKITPKLTQKKSNTDKKRIHHPMYDISQRKEQFRKDFPNDPVPSDAILLRLYANIMLPPPLFNNSPNAKPSRSEDIPSTPLSRKLSQPVITSEDLRKDGDATSQLTFDSSVEWKVSKAAVDKSKKVAKGKNSASKNINDESRRSESSSKSKISSASSRRSSNREQKPTDSFDRERSRSGTRSHSRGHNSKIKEEASTSGRSSSSMHDFSKDVKASKRKGRRREGLSHSAHGKLPSPTSPSKSTKKTDTTMTIKNNTSTNLFSHSPKESSDVSSAGTDGFQNALLDLSNGSFFETYDEVHDDKTSTSFTLLRNSSKTMNSQVSFNDSEVKTKSSLNRSSSQGSINDSVGFASSGAESFAESDDKTEKERRKKRRGKREISVSSDRRSDLNSGNSVGSDRKSNKSSGNSVSSDRKSHRKSRSTSAEGRSTGTKTRRGRRGSTTSRAESSPLLEDSESYDFEASLNDIRQAISREGSRTNLVDESKAKQRRSPKPTSKKNSRNNARDESGKRSVRDESGKRSVRDESGKRSVRDESGKRSIRDESGGSKKSTRDESGDKLLKSPKHVPKSLVKSSLPVNDSALLPTSSNKGVPTEEDFYDLALSSWVDRPKESVQQSSLSRNAEPPKRKSSLKNNSRWLSEIPSTSRNEVDTTDVKVSHFSDQVASIHAGPSIVSSTPKQKRKQLDFPLNFLEYSDVSPLTIASKKVGGIKINNGMRPR